MKKKLIFKYLVSIYLINVSYMNVTQNNLLMICKSCDISARKDLTVQI